VLRYVILVATVSALSVSGYGYVMAVRGTSDPDAAERIVTWGADARAEVWIAETRHYRTLMRWGSGLGILLFLGWAVLSSR
jgi:hypothetical protein